VAVTAAEAERLEARCVDLSCAEIYDLNWYVKLTKAMNASPKDDSKVTNPNGGTNGDSGDARIHGGSGESTSKDDDDGEEEPKNEGDGTEEPDDQAGDKVCGLDGSGIRGRFSSLRHTGWGT
jgi:hypothetical protein